MIYARTNEFALVIASATSTAGGVTVTPGNNTYGSYAQVIAGSSVTDDAYGIWINVNANAVSGAARNSIAKLGLDQAGGTSYTDTILDLGCACAGDINAAGGGISYYFPLLIKSGTSVGIAVSVNNATVGTCKSYCRLFCKPVGIPPRAGSFVRTFGSSPSTSAGTAVTPNGSGSKSAYVQLGSAVADTLWAWCLGVGCNNSSMTNTAAGWDLAIGTSSQKQIVINDQLVMPGATETLSYISPAMPGLAVSGDLVYVRAGSNAPSATGLSAIAYGVGG